ncbi:MAG: ester cyclase [Propionibacteriales bacterium]|nr:ester cyclase [Propionibacteriales bacterium]
MDKLIMEDEVDDTDGAAGLAVLQRMFCEGFETGNADIVDELCAPDLIEHQFGLSGSGSAAIENVKAAIRDVHRAAPDLRFTMEDWAVEHETIWVRMRAVGTATGPFFGPPSGCHLDFAVVDVARVVDGVIAEHWGVPDRFAMLAQTGVLDRVLA